MKKEDLLALFEKKYKSVDNTKLNRNLFSCAILAILSIAPAYASSLQQDKEIIHSLMWTSVSILAIAEIFGVLVIAMIVPQIFAHFKIQYTCAFMSAEQKKAFQKAWGSFVNVKTKDIRDKRYLLLILNQYADRFERLCCKEKK